MREWTCRMNHAHGKRFQCPPPPPQMWWALGQWPIWPTGKSGAGVTLKLELKVTRGPRGVKQWTAPKKGQRQLWNCLGRPPVWNVTKAWARATPHVTSYSHIWKRYALYLNLIAVDRVGQSSQLFFRVFFNGVSGHQTFHENNRYILYCDPIIKVKVIIQTVWHKQRLSGRPCYTITKTLLLSFIVFHYFDYDN